MAQEMANSIKSVASRNVLQVRSSQMLLPSDVRSVTSTGDSGERVSLQHLVPYHQNCHECFSCTSRKKKCIKVVRGG